MKHPNNSLLYLIRIVSLLFILLLSSTFASAQTIINPGDTFDFDTYSGTPYVSNYHNFLDPLNPLLDGAGAQIFYNAFFVKSVATLYARTETAIASKTYQFKISDGPIAADLDSLISITIDYDGEIDITDILGYGEFSFDLILKDETEDTTVKELNLAYEHIWNGLWHYFGPVYTQMNAPITRGHTYSLEFKVKAEANIGFIGVTNIVSFAQEFLTPSYGIFLESLSIQVPDDPLGAIYTVVQSIEQKVDYIKSEVDAIEVKADSLIAKTNSIETKVDALQAKCDTIESKIDDIESKIDNLQDDMDETMEREIEEYLYSGISLVSIYLPASMGGRLELVQAVVEKWINQSEAAGFDVTQARKFFNAGIGYFNAKNYKDAFDNFSKAYRQLVFKPKVM